MTKQFNFFITSPRGVEHLLAGELLSLGAAGVKEGHAGVFCAGPLELGYRLCLWSRIAGRVLLPLTVFPADSPDELYRGILAVQWDDYLLPEGTLAVDFAGGSAFITDTRFGAVKVKDAIVDQFRERYGVRPSVSRERPELRVAIRLHKGMVTASIDLSGESLHRRGYREEHGEAPLKENLAAAILHRAGWADLARNGAPLLDPMCGSGTFPIEAALMAMDCAPGLFRDYFGFLGGKNHDTALWERLWEEALQRREAGLNRTVVIAGYDRDEKVLRTARSNAERAGMAGIIRFERREIGEARPPVSGTPPGLVVINPPYGERLGRGEDLATLYARLGNVLKREFRGWTAALLTGSEERRPIGLKPRKVTTLYNGALACTLSLFDIAEVDTSRQKEPHPPPDLPPFDSLRLPVDFAQGPRSGQAAHDGREGKGTIISTATLMSPGAESFANRLRKNLRNLEIWTMREKVTCYRLYDADLPEYNMAVDLYGGERLFAHVQEYEAPKTVDAGAADRRFREVMAIVPEVVGITREQLFFKVRKRQKGPSQYTRLAAATGQFYPVSEGPCRFLVNFSDYLDTGLFLDHRPTRELLRTLATGKRFLNLFGYTGTATVHAAVGGAVATTTVDLSSTYLDWAGRNLELNGFNGKNHELVRAECREWLGTTAREGKRRWGLIFLDPPSFSNSKRMDGTFDVQRDHAALIGQAVELLEPNGILIFSTNLQSFVLDTGVLAGLVLEDITPVTIPPDFRRNPRIHSCWRITLP